MLKQNENNLFCDSGLWFLWCQDIACDWLQRGEHSGHVSGVSGNVITAVIIRKVVILKPRLLYGID